MDFSGSVHSLFEYRGGSKIHGKGVHMYKSMGVRVADFISLFVKYPMKMK